MSILRKRYSGDDPRLQRPPYSDHCVQYIVHRHVIRIAQSYHNVHRSAARHGRRVYVVLASDTPRSGDAERFTHQMRKALLEIAQPRKTKYLPGQCVFHLGMRLLLFSKKCVRLGLMNGCACVLVDIVFSAKGGIADRFKDRRRRCVQVHAHCSSVAGGRCAMDYATRTVSPGLAACVGSTWSFSVTSAGSAL